MAPNATIHRLAVSLSDVDRNVYEMIELRVARHPSETVRYMLTRTLAYCLSFEEGIAFSKGGLSDADEPPLSIRDATGRLLAWIDVGSPSAERLHRASKAAERVSIYTSADLALLRREASTRPVHRMEEIDVWHVEPAFLDAIEPKIEKSTSIELLRTGGQLYATIGDSTIEGPIERASLVG